MQFTWLIKNNSKKLILFFNGWSLDENIVNHLATENFDVLMFYDYANLEISQEIIEEINSYEEINVISWSFGVWACGAVINNFNNLKNVIAINGTLLPIDNNLGIPEKIFDLTLSHLSEENYIRFFKNMFENKEKGNLDLSKLPKRTIQNQKQELQQIQKLSALPPRPLWEREEFQCEERVLEIRVRGNAENIKFFNKIFISTNDKIIPPKNQLDFWEKSNAKIIKKESGHYIFDLFKTWDEIIND
jgi:biotin synthesis protein BioG